MALLNQELVHFEEVEEVIKVRKGEKASTYVEKYVISESLRRNLLYMLEILSGATHKSFNVVGNYGTGKSHFLAFVAAILERPELRSMIQDDVVREAAQKLDRRYLVVKFELPAAAEVPLRRIFFDQIQQQLLADYDVEVRDVHLETDYDNKQNVLNVLADLKAEDPEAGLVVIVDEISDFLKQKTKEGMSYDLALLRELGEISQDSDFLYIGAMQEHVFTDPKYVEQAESIARVNQRFVTVTITKEDVAHVLTQRVVRKDADQLMQLAALLGDHQQYFPNLAAQLDRYVALYPIHPYVIDVFERLPYFENRGIIGFAVDNVKPILGDPAPRFITYDRIFDLINTTHEIRNQPNVAPVVAAVQTLETKIDLLDADYRDDARRLIKALAVLNLLGSEQGQGATAQELANTLLITPPRKLIVDPGMAQGHIQRVMMKVRDVTVGQFIAYGEDGRYALDLSIVEDFDARIEQKANSAVDDAEVQLAFRTFVEDELGVKGQLSYQAGISAYPDTAPWPSRRAFREGVLIIGKRDDGANVRHGDYRFVVQGPMPGKSTGRQDEVVLSLDFTDELTGLLTRARAAELLAQDNVHKKEMTKIHREALNKFRKQYVADLLTRGYVTHGGHETALTQLPTSKPLNVLADVVDHVKGAILDPVFADKYHKFPTLRTLVTAANLEGEMTRALQALDRAATQQLDLNARGYLEAFDAMRDGRFSASSSEVCQTILSMVDTRGSAKLTPVEAVTKQLGDVPWGLPREMVQMLLGALLFNGYLIFVQQGGKRLHAGDVGGLLKQGMGFFDQISYLELEGDLDVEGVVALFDILGLQAGLVRDRDSRSEAVKDLRVKGTELQGQLALLRRGMQDVVTQAANYPDVPWLAVQDRLAKLQSLDTYIAQFADVSKVSDLGRLPVAKEALTRIKVGLDTLDTLTGFLNDWHTDGLDKAIQRMQQALEVLPNLVPFAHAEEKLQIERLQQIWADSRGILSDADQLLRSEYRRPLKGKAEQFRSQYDQLYFRLHERIVGDQAPWDKIGSLRSQQHYVGLNRLKSLPLVSSAEFTQLALKLQQLDRLHCQRFSADVLDAFVTCPYCDFPEGSQGLTNLTAQLAQLQDQLDEVWRRWEEKVLSELPELVARLDLLSETHREQIEALQLKGKLPEEISDPLISALQELTSDLQPIDLLLDDLGAFLLSQGSALTVQELRNGLNAYVNKRIVGHDSGLVRFRIVTQPTQD